jgi:predicted secreted protein
MKLLLTKLLVTLMKIQLGNLSKALFALITFLLFALPVQAGTHDNLHFIGFSDNGKYMAFEAYGISDGSGHGYSKITMLNVARNSWVSAPIKTGTETDMFTEQQARTNNRAKASAKLAELGIVDGVTGTHVVSRKITDLTATSGPVRFAQFVASSFQIGDYELNLTEMPVTSSSCAVHTPPARKIFELSLKNRETNSTQVLQKDTRLPSSRYCPKAYRIAEVFMHEKKLVVFLNMFNPGFEGDSMSYLAVTGLMN